MEKITSLNHINTSEGQCTYWHSQCRIPEHNKPHQEYARDYIGGYLGVWRVVVLGRRSQVVVETGLQQSHQGCSMLLDAAGLPGHTMRGNKLCTRSINWIGKWYHFSLFWISPKNLLWLMKYNNYYFIYFSTFSTDIRQRKVSIIQRSDLFSVTQTRQTKTM